MYCSNCGNQLNDKAVVCPKCGCIANDIMYQAAFNTASQQNTNSNTYHNPSSEIQPNNNHVQVNNDKPNPAFSILSFFLPIFGIIIFLSERKIKPRASKRYLLWSVLSIVLSVIFFIVYIATIIFITLYEENLI